MTNYQKQVVTQLLKQAGYKEQEKWWENNDIKSAIMKAELFADDPSSPPSLNAGSLEEAAEKYANEKGFKVISEDDDEGAASHKYIVDAVIYGASLSQGAKPLKDALEKIQAKQIPDSPHETQIFIAEVFNICDKALEPYKNSK